MITFDIDQHYLRKVPVVVIRRNGEVVATLVPGDDENSIRLLSAHFDVVDVDDSAPSVVEAFSFSFKKPAAPFVYDPDYREP